MQRIIQNKYFHPVLYCGSILIDSIYILRDYFTGIWDLRLPHCQWSNLEHYSDVIMGTMASQVTSLTIVYSTVYLGTDKKKHQSLASLALVRGIHRWILRTKGQWRGKCFHLMTYHEDMGEYITWFHSTTKPCTPILLYIAHMSRYAWFPGISSDLSARKLITPST